jgi:hypothetical protein
MDDPASDLTRRAFLRRAVSVTAAGVAWAGCRTEFDQGSVPGREIATAGTSRVHQTARAELATALAGRAAPARIVLGLPGETPEVASLATRGLIRLHEAPAALDAYELLVHGQTLFLLGNTPRGMLHAVFALRELLEEGATLGENFRRSGVFQFSHRIFHPRFDPWPGTRADVRFVAHLGATHCLVSHDWQGSRRSLQGYVTSPIFPAAVGQPEVAANHAALRRLLEDCGDYGLGAMLWVTELPCQGGPWVPPAERARFLMRYPAEVLSESGTYEGKVLCFGHPRVQEFYRDLLGRFFADFPEIETLFLFGSDSGGEFCDPGQCPRCHGLSQIAQRDRLVCFLIAEGQRVRPGLRVLTTGWGWDDHAEFLPRQAALPQASGLYLAAQKDGWQCERQSHDFLREARRVCRERGQTFIGHDNFHWGDDTVHGLGDIQDFPLGVGAKIRRWHALGADGVFDHWGNSPEDLWCNSIACREFFLDPQADAGAVCRRLAHRQFGARAGELAFGAWAALECAHEALSAACTWAPAQWPMWYAGRKTAPLPGLFSSEALRRTQQAPRTSGKLVYNPADFAASLQAVADAWRQAWPHYAEAARLLGAAHDAADDGPLFYRFWWNGPQPTPTRREHLRRQHLYVESVGLAGREIGLHFGLHSLWEKTSRDPQAYRARAASMLREDAAACRAAARFFGTLGKPHDWPEQYQAKANAIEDYLAFATGTTQRETL